jgi:hypothetical protein
MDLSHTGEEARASHGAGSVSWGGGSAGSGRCKHSYPPIVAGALMRGPRLVAHGWIDMRGNDSA